MLLPNPRLPVDERADIVLEMLRDKGVVTFDFGPVYSFLHNEVNAYMTVEECYTYVYNILWPQIRSKSNL